MRCLASIMTCLRPKRRCKRQRSHRNPWGNRAIIRAKRRAPLFIAKKITINSSYLARSRARPFTGGKSPTVFAVQIEGKRVADGVREKSFRVFERRELGVGWSLGLTGEAGYLLALVGGLLIGNLSPRAAAWFKDAARPELFIKAGIVVYGAVLGAKAAEESGRATAILFRGLAAIIEAYLVYWALVYLIARKVFGFSREWSAPLASGISICGVTAAIATGAAIRARPVVPVMVSSLVVVFAVIEMLVLPGLAHRLLPGDPMVAAGWMGLAVKTDGAAFASGELAAGYFYPDPADPARKWMALTTTTVKVFIDVFIGVWAVVLSVVWAWKIEPRADRGRLPLAEIWERFPKFVFGYAVTFGAFFAVGWAAPDALPALKRGADQADVFRRLFFVLTFFSIGLATDVRRLWAEGLGRLALVYVVSLFGFVIWIGLAISWLLYAPLGGWATLPRMLEERQRYVALSFHHLLYRFLLARGVERELIWRLTIQWPTLIYLACSVALASLLVGWRQAGREQGRAEDARGFWQAATAANLFYLLVGSFWFQTWYVLWVLAPAALLPASRFTRLVLPWLCWGVLCSNVVADYLPQLAQPPFTRTGRLFLAVMLVWAPAAVAAVTALAVMLRRQSRRKLTATPNC